MFWFKSKPKESWFDKSHRVAAARKAGDLDICMSDRGHSWEEPSYWNGGFYHCGALARRGQICRHCSALKFPETNQEFFDSLPSWLKKEISEQNPALRAQTL